MKIIRDPIHEYISMYDNELDLLNCALFQRLRNIKQNGMAYYVYPSLTVNRFEHSLGVMHLADKMLSTALKESDPNVVKEFLELCCKEFGWENNDKVKSRLSRVIRIVGMLHDLGHLPFSHTFEELLHQSIVNIMPSDAVERWKDYVATVGGALHEFLTVFLIEFDSEISDAIGEDKDLVLKILQASPFNESAYNTLHEIVAGDIDADRGDYLLRDGFTSGAEFGKFDLTRLVEGMRLAKVTTRNIDTKESYVFRPTIQALSAVESLVIERYKSYRWLYHHHRVVITNRLLEEITWRILKNHWDSQEPLNSIQMGFPFSKPKSIFDSSSKATFLDDVDLHHILRQAKLLLEKPGGPNELLRPTNYIEINEFSALLDEILYRKKRGVSLWKDIGAYKKFNDRIAVQIESIFEEHQCRE
ncbi:HD domain-containing protein, partial [Chloroflexota bacterium]